MCERKINLHCLGAYITNCSTPVTPLKFARFHYQTIDYLCLNKVQFSLASTQLLTVCFYGRPMLQYGCHNQAT